MFWKKIRYDNVTKGVANFQLYSDRSDSTGRLISRTLNELTLKVEIN